MACTAACSGKVRSGLFLLLISFVVISETLAKNIDAYSYYTAYACEEKTLKIECKDGELIKLIRANYGRFSITICNDHGRTDWSVDCMSPKSLRVLTSKCSNYQNCSVLASTNMFGDPCPGTHKYLEAHYQCLPASTTTTTNRPSPPPWLLTSVPPVWNTAKPTEKPPPPPSPPIKMRTTTLNKQTPISVPTISSVTTNSAVTTPTPRITATTTTTTTSTTTTAAPITHTTKTTSTTTTTSSVETKNEDEYKEGEEDDYGYMTSKSSQHSPITTAFPKSGIKSDPSNILNVNIYCSPTSVRNIYWGYTKVNSSDIQPCPGGTTGFAKWRCIHTGGVGPTGEPVTVWSPSMPDLSQCRSVWLTSLEQRINIGRDPLVMIINDLAQVTSSKTLYGGDMMITTKMIQKMAQKMSKDLQTFPDTRQREVIVTEMLNDVVKTGSNLLDTSQHPSWRDLSYKEQMRVATSLLIGLEENAFLLADTVTREKTVNQQFNNILISVRVLETRSVQNQVFRSNAKWSSSNNYVELSQGALHDNSDGGLVRLVFVAFDGLDEILQWQPEESGPPDLTRVLNSKVISASLGKGRHIQLKEPVRLTLSHIRTENVSNPSCVFWDYTTNVWLEEGCRLETTNKTHTVCLCDHLTNFAILMDVHDVHLSEPHQIALKVITYVGCIISIICLVLAVLTFQLFRSIKNDRTTIHSNLCFCLLVAELLFVMGIDKTEDKMRCGIIAGFLEYFFLCAFAWMFFEGFQLYVMLVEIFETEKSRIKWYYIISYGFPALIILISALVYPQGYGTDQYCWLQKNNYFIFSFVGPVIVVLLLNSIFLIMAIIKMYRHTSATMSIKNKEHSRLASTSSWIKGAILLLILLGGTWTFGFLYLNQETVAIAYIFAVLNSLQGFFIFLLHCLQNEKICKEYRKFARRHSWLPNCLQCSKQVNASTSSNSGGSSGKEQRTSIYAGSNENQSNCTDHTVLSPHVHSVGSNNLNNSISNVQVPMRTDLYYNISFKSYSRDSGHGGSEQEESPRAHSIVTGDTRLNNAKESIGRRPPHHHNHHNHHLHNHHHHGSHPQHHMIYDADEQHFLNDFSIDRERRIIQDSNALQPKNIQTAAVAALASSPTPQSSQVTSIPTLLLHHHHHHQHHDGGSTGRRKNKTHWSGAQVGVGGNHTYTEIYDDRGVLGMEDPVYEEIERSAANQEILASDMSDEENRRQSDMSRQSSRSYGDHRPLIQYSSGTCSSNSDRTNQLLDTINIKTHMDTTSFRMYRDNPRALAAVLDGETVVCHLEPPEQLMYPPTNTMHDSRNLVLPNYSES